MPVPFSELWMGQEEVMSQMPRLIEKAESKLKKAETRLKSMR